MEEYGTVKFFHESKGYGYIDRDSGGEVFVHQSGIVGYPGTKISQGNIVRFEVVETRSRPQAIHVIRFG
jgi:CspA family cold shock protein